MPELGKLLIGLGLVLIIIGALVLSGFRGLPGDISIRSERSSFHFPIVSCLVLSALLTLLFRLFRKG